VIKGLDEDIKRDIISEPKINEAFSDKAYLAIRVSTIKCSRYLGQLSNIKTTRRRQ
jgi:hypothetical protein